MRGMTPLGDMRGGGDYSSECCRGSRGGQCGADGSCCCLPAMHECNTLDEVSVDHAHFCVHPIRATVIAGSPNISLYLQCLKDGHLYEPEGPGV